MIIGVTGTIASGKDTVADYLEERGFARFSLADELREIVKDRGLETNRDNLFLVGNDVRTRFGSDYLAKLVIQKFQTDNRDAVVTSIRHLDELIALRAFPNFYLISVDAPPKDRYARAQARGRITDNVTLEKFIEQEERELRGSGPVQQVKAVMAKADFEVQNNGTIADFEQNIERIMDKIREGLEKS